MNPQLVGFTATNGIRVYLDDDKVLRWDGSSNGERKEDITQAFREFFMAERDAELGRWRSKEHPDVICYPVGKTGKRVRMFDETNAIDYEVSKGNLDKPWFGGWTKMHNAAREFFAALPEPKPWHDAKPGEVWVLDVTGYGSGAYLVDQTREFQGAVTRNPESESITAGRRIWPGVSA